MVELFLYRDVPTFHSRNVPFAFLSKCVERVELETGAKRFSFSLVPSFRYVLESWLWTIKRST